MMAKMNWKNVLEGVQRCVTHAVNHFQENQKDSDPAYYADLTHVYTWPQRWSSTACGFGGMAGQAGTTAQTVVVDVCGIFYVYHAGRLAYVVRRNHGAFYEAMRSQRLPGASLRDKVEELGDDVWFPEEVIQP